MNLEQVNIRPICKSDNKELARLIRTILEDLNVPKEGSTYADKELDRMYECFTIPGAAYFVVEESGKILGGAGVIHLKDSTSEICELQKMYIHPLARGRGLGSQLLQKCLDTAIKLGYKKCYLETMSDMKVAQELYERAGFRILKHRMGATGHYVCPIWMIKDLD